MNAKEWKWGDKSRAKPNLRTCLNACALFN